MTQAATRTRWSSGDLRQALGEEFGRHGHPLGRGFFDRLQRDHPELSPAETVAGVRLWTPAALELFRAAIRREREGGR